MCFREDNNGGNERAYKASVLSMFFIIIIYQYFSWRKPNRIQGNQHLPLTGILLECYQYFFVVKT